MEKQKNIPALRFPEFGGEWQLKNAGLLTKRISIPVIIEEDKYYQQIGIRSHGKGIFYKDPVTGKSLGNKRVFWVKENVFVVNIVFAWEQAVAKTTDKEIGMIASHRFPMYQPIDNQLNLDYLLQFFLTPKGKLLLELASPGGAGRNKTLGQKEFENLKFLIPSCNEQTKIATFLTAVDDRLNQLKQKKTLLEQYKRGVMQKIFDQEIRFKDDDGNDYPEWEEKTLGNYLVKHVEKTTENNQYPVLTSSRKGLFFQKDYFDGNDVASNDNTGYNVVPRNYFTYRHMSDDVTFKFNINTLCDKGIVSTLYPVFTTQNINDRFLQLKLNEGAEFIKYAIEQKQGGSRTYMYFNKLEQLRLFLPSIGEQTKIANFLSAIDEKINQSARQIEKTEQYKKGLLQQMFV